MNQYPLEDYIDVPLFGDYLRSHRIRYGDSQKQLADVLGVKNTFISRVENGTRSFTRILLSRVIERYARSKREADLFHRSYDYTFLYEQIDLRRMTVSDRLLAVRLVRLLGTVKQDDVLRDDLDAILHRHEVERGMRSQVTSQDVEVDYSVYVGGYTNGIQR